MSSITDTPDLTPYRVIVFDLDNTLYDESQYLFQVYVEIAAFFEKKLGLDRTEIFQFLEKTFTESGFSRIYDKLFARFQLSQEYLEDCLSIQRSISLAASLALFSRMEALINNCLEKGKKVYVLTNGHLTQQKNKVRQLDWKGLQERISIIYANEIAPKPSPEALFHIMQQERTSAEEMLFIGDSDTDKQCAEAAGVKFINAGLFLRES